MFKTNVIDSSRYSTLIDERLKIKSKERMRPKDLFSDPYYQKSDSEKNYIDTISENTCKNMLKNVWSHNNEGVKGDLHENPCIGNKLYNYENNFYDKKINYKKEIAEQKLENKLEKFIKNTSPSKQKLFREFSTGIVLGDEDNSREKMMHHISNTLNNQSNEEKDNIGNFKLIYPYYSNIFNDENLNIHTELSKKFLLKGPRMSNFGIGDECVAMLLTPDTLKYYRFDRETKTYKAIKDSSKNFVAEEYNLDNVIPVFTPLQKNLSSKLHGSDFYNKAAIRSSETVFTIRFRLINISSEINEKAIQNTAANCGAFAYQIIFEFDPIKWSSKGTATGMLRYSGDSLDIFKNKLLEIFNIKVEILSRIQEDLI
ncbi:uncharacterized protein cubi_00575 [Cryptosporidium ubiquitum]|uniref:Uncharacterized protein n=1 Tax=Cryptosporidium ubiquitum TaxID=857276 RepID=A0A1J4MC12_9CRYT|nr:uncharacterized protein cubi_00575 [Cryptosporidium ubiquitum]OII71768.1 hypothetical protein cubi_00575 [Cryptosporidium ubiquitum]